MASLSFTYTHVYDYIIILWLLAAGGMRECRFALYQRDFSRDGIALIIRSRRSNCFLLNWHGCVKAVDTRRATAISQTIRITAIPLIYVHRTRAPVLFHEIMRWRTHAKLTRILHFDENNLVPNARIIRMFALNTFKCLI